MTIQLLQSKLNLIFKNTYIGFTNDGLECFDSLMENRSINFEKISQIANENGFKTIVKGIKYKKLIILKNE